MNGTIAAMSRSPKPSAIGLFERGQRHRALRQRHPEPVGQRRGHGHVLAGERDGEGHVVDASSR
jgi:hypothetical protein